MFFKSADIAGCFEWIGLNWTRFNGLMSHTNSSAANSACRLQHRNESETEYIKFVETRPQAIQKAVRSHSRKQQQLNGGVGDIDANEEVGWMEVLWPRCVEIVVTLYEKLSCAETPMLLHRFYAVSRF